MWRFSDRKIKFADTGEDEIGVASVHLCATYAGWLMGTPDEARLRETLQTAIDFHWRCDIPAVKKFPVSLHMGKPRPVKGHHPEKEYWLWPETMVMAEFEGPSAVGPDGQESDGTVARIVWLTDSDGEEGIFTLLQRLVTETEIKWTDVCEAYWL